MNKHQTGFTLLELMIAIALGLLVVAASLMVFLTGQRSLGMQVGLCVLINIRVLLKP